MKALREAGYLTSLNNLVKVRVKAPLPREIERYTIERCTLQARIMNVKEGCVTDNDDNDHVVKDKDDVDAENSQLDHFQANSNEPYASGHSTKDDTEVRKNMNVLYHPHINNSIRNLQKLLSKSKSQVVVEQINEWLQNAKLDMDQLPSLLEAIGMEKSTYDALK